jgi:hypothetical protein
MEKLLSNWVIGLLNKEKYTPVLTTEEIIQIKEIEEFNFIAFLLFLESKGHINDYDFSYEDVVKEFLGLNENSLSEEDEIKINLHNKREQIRHLLKMQKEYEEELEMAQHEMFILEDRLKELDKNK